MIQLLFTVILFEMALTLSFVFKTPLRKLVIMGLDRAKRGRGPLVVKTVAGTIAVVLCSSLYSMAKIRSRWMNEDGGAASPNPTDQVLFAGHMLESTLMGAILFLALMIDRLHHYMRELRLRRKSMEAAKKRAQTQGDSGDGKSGASDELKSLEGETKALRLKLEQLESELETKKKDLSAAEANAVALSKQSEGFLLEYDRLLEENQNLRNQLQSLDQRFSRSGSKKNI
ncbi:uncharacterized protein LOC116206316 [Punica granatum]|uniref:Endoplasmic reticulum transmembrane protein n=2 Tax=Punica granatum TaxID=22663 RepID=A0A218XF25_PUNGR|nr:uncharacterized protein LOC116206316 [Punica granatum]OWM83408.1 hypothetical protein CDL15_Pgr012889 [Punica granatum]PKI48860.1 hypothetical protein CRG98_030708 [Punica granatum]